MISVCMATRNGARFLREQIDSILPQLGGDDELIISDDHSSDDTVDIIKSYADRRIKLHASNKDLGIVLNFEKCITHARGEVIFLADQDDVWHGDKIKRMANALLRHDVVICDCTVTCENLQIQHPSLFEINDSRRGLLKNLYRNSYVGCCMAFRKSVLEKALPFPKDIPMHDSWIGLIGEVYFNVYFLKEPLVYYRRHANAFSSTGRKSGYRYPIRVYQRLKVIKNLVSRRIK